MVSAKLCSGRRSESNLKKPPAVSQIKVLVGQPVFEQKISIYHKQVFLKDWKEKTPTSPSFCCGIFYGILQDFEEDLENSPHEHFHEAC